MTAFKKFFQRNLPVFVIGLIILILFVLIILTSPKEGGGNPAGFKKVGEEVFENREPAEPEPTEVPEEYAPQTPSTENKGKRYFYGEYDPTLRDSEGYPTPPQPGSSVIPEGTDSERTGQLRVIEKENYAIRTKTININFTGEGFKPVDVMAFTGQKIVWNNKTDKEIFITPVSESHEAIKNGFSIAPGQSYVFRPLIDIRFTYMEKNSSEFGTVIVNDSTRPLVTYE